MIGASTEFVRKQKGEGGHVDGEGVVLKIRELEVNITKQNRRNKGKQQEGRLFVKRMFNFNLMFFL